MTKPGDLSAEHAFWLGRIVESSGGLDVRSIPDDMHDALVERGLVQVRDGVLEATTEGGRQWERFRPITG